MGIVLDSSALIKIERNRGKENALLEDLKDEDCFISVITASELLHGVERAKDLVTKARRTAFVEGILSRITVISIDTRIARVHAAIWAELAVRGMMIGIHDSWIAATCLTFDLTLISDNAREFKRVKGLKLKTGIK